MLDKKRCEINYFTLNNVTTKVLQLNSLSTNNRRAKGGELGTYNCNIQPKITKK